MPTLQLTSAATPFVERIAVVERPLIHINVAMDRDGSLASFRRNGESISCNTDWRRVHELREQYDAVAVGGRTWLMDRPRLDVRSERLGRAPNRQPARVIFAGSHRCAVTPVNRPTYVIGSTLLEGKGICAMETQGCLLRRPLQWLYHNHIRSMLVEGGPTLLWSFLEQGCVDRLTVFVRAACPESALSAANTLFSGFPLISTQPLGEGVLLEWSGRLEEFQLPVVHSLPGSKLLIKNYSKSAETNRA